jgi:Tol biopolymer transport system component
MWFVYFRIQNGKADIMKVKTSGQATPMLLKADINQTNAAVPTWSPNGEWVEYNDKGENLISPDGKTMRSLGDLHADGCTFSHDGRLLYCLRADKDSETLFSFDIASGAQKTVGHLDPEFRPRSNLDPAIRLSLAPDGKSIVYGTARSSVSNLWLLEGFAPKDGWLNRIFSR